MDHLLLHCDVAYGLWSKVFKIFGNILSVVALLLGWRNLFGRHYSDVWSLTPLFFMWKVWRKGIPILFRIRSNPVII